MNLKPSQDIPVVRATASTPDGFEITVFYTRDLIPENKCYDPLFKNLDGLPLEYELQKGNLQYKIYTGVHQPQSGAGVKI